MTGVQDVNYWTFWKVWPLPKHKELRALDSIGTGSIGMLATLALGRKMKKICTSPGCHLG
jgi:hypothetical protein